jgi:hypothetical protein
LLHWGECCCYYCCALLFSTRTCTPTTHLCHQWVGRCHEQHRLALGLEGGQLAANHLSSNQCLAGTCTGQQASEFCLSARACAVCMGMCHAWDVRLSVFLCRVRTAQHGIYEHWALIMACCCRSLVDTCAVIDSCVLDAVWTHLLPER